MVYFLIVYLFNNPCNFSTLRVKKLEATNTEQQQQAGAQAEAAQAQATSTLTDAQMVAAAYYQAQFMLLASSTASTPTTDDGSGAALDGNALSEYYRQFLGYVWNDRTPTSSDVEDAGTPLPSDKENKKKEQVLDTHAGPGEAQVSSDKPKELKAKGKRTSNGERERRKVKRSRRHKRSSTEDTLSAISTATEQSSATETDKIVQKEEVDCHKSPNGQGSVPPGAVEINNKVCPSLHDPHHQKGNGLHQSDKCMEASTNANKHCMTCAISEKNNCDSPSEEKPLPKRHREDQGTKELYRTEQEPHRETREAQRKGGVQRLCSSSQSPTNSPTHERMHRSGMSNGYNMEKSTSSHGVTVNHSTDPDYGQLNSPNRGKQSPNRHREGRHTKETQREMKKHHIESTDVQGVINDPHRGNHITRSHSSSRSPHSPTSQNVNGRYLSNSLDGSTDKFALNGDSKAHSKTDGVSPSHRTPRIEKHSPKRNREDKAMNKSYREVRDPHREVREPCRETRRIHRDAREQHTEGDREMMETHREMMDPHRERRGMHREMREKHRMTKEAYRDTRETHRETRMSYKGEPQHRETREAHRHTCMRVSHREITEAHKDPHRNIQEPQVETMELCRDRRMAQRETREAHRDRGSSGNRRSHSSSRLSSVSRLRSRSPSYDKENISRPPSSSQERQPRREPMGRSNSLERSGEDISSKRMSNRKRKLSNSSQSASQHYRKQARKESYQEDSRQTRVDRYSRSSAKSSLESSPKRSDLLASPVNVCPDFDDIIAPPTPNANEILPYSTDIQLCENSTMLPYDAGARKNMSDIISCPPTPTSELQGMDEDEEIMNNKDIERESNTKESENKPLINLNSKQSNEKSMEVKDQETSKSCLDGDDNPLASDGAVSGGGEPKTEDVVDENGDKEKEEASDLEEGEITDSDSDSGDEIESATKKETRAGDEPDKCIERRQMKTSESYRTQETEKRAFCEQLSEERRPRRSSYHGSGYHPPRHSPQPSHHTPLSERRNRHSSPSLRRRNELYDRDSHVIVKHSHSDKHAQCRRSSRHLRSNLPEQIY